MVSPFDWINSITTSKKNLIDEGEPESSYNPFMVNRGLSYFPDTILYAAEINMLPHLDKKLQYEFHLHAIRQKKRFSKWAKSKKKNADIETVCKYYGFSFTKASAALALLTEDQLKLINSSFEEGGTKK